MLAWCQAPATDQFNKYLQALLEERLRELVVNPRKFITTTHYEQMAAELVDNSDVLRGQIMMLEQILDLKNMLKVELPKE